MEDDVLEKTEQGVEAHVCVHLSKLILSHFRCYEALKLAVDERPVVLFGANGAGKTNILEAISFLAPGRGFRRAKLSDVDKRDGVGSEYQGSVATPSLTLPLKGEGISSRKGGPHPNPLPEGEGISPWAVSAEVHTAQGSSQVGTGREVGDSGRDKRVIRIDGKGVRGQAALARAIPLNWITPQMDQVFVEGGSARRRLLDRLVMNFEPEHATRVNAYEQSMRERNRLLVEQPGQKNWFVAVEKKMSELAVLIALARLQFLEVLERSGSLGDSGFPKAQITLAGSVENAIKQGCSALEAEELFCATLEEKRPYDTAAGRTSEGVHKSHLFVHHTAKRMEAADCSTGEQKALLLSMILSQAAARKARFGAAPVLLLDEVVAHLDAKRRAELFEVIEALGSQAWLTGTDRALFEALEGKAQFIEVSDGMCRIL